MSTRPGLPSEIRTPKQEFIDSFDGEFPPLQEKVRRDEIGGLDMIVENLDVYKRAINFPKLYEMYGVRPPRGFILSGPPGCGKTYIAKYLAEELGARFVDIPLSKYESKWVGQAEKKLTEYINMCRVYTSYIGKPVILFFDEAEEAFKSRSMPGWHAPRVNVLLREMDGLSGDNEGLYFGAATNHVDKVDSALMRPGRLDHHIIIPEYSAKALGDVFRAIKLRLNRRAQHFNPFYLSNKDCNNLGDYAYNMSFTPAHVNGAFSRATSKKIKRICDVTIDEVISKEECLITVDDLFDELREFEVIGDKKTVVGFKV